MNQAALIFTALTISVGAYAADDGLSCSTDKNGRLVCAPAAATPAAKPATKPKSEKVEKPNDPSVASQLDKNEQVKRATFCADAPEIVGAMATGKKSTSAYTDKARENYVAYGCGTAQAFDKKVEANRLKWVKYSNEFLRKNSNTPAPVTKTNVDRHTPTAVKPYNNRTTVVTDPSAK